MSIKTSKRIALGVIASLVFAPFAAIAPASATADFSLVQVREVTTAPTAAANGSTATSTDYTAATHVASSVYLTTNNKYLNIKPNATMLSLGSLNVRVDRLVAPSGEVAATSLPQALGASAGTAQATSGARSFYTGFGDGESTTNSAQFSAKTVATGGKLGFAAAPLASDMYFYLATGDFNTAGTYTLRVYVDMDSSGSFTSGDVSQNVTFTVGGAATKDSVSLSKSTVITGDIVTITVSSTDGTRSTIPSTDLVTLANQFSSCSVGTRNSGTSITLAIDYFAGVSRAICTVGTVGGLVATGTATTAALGAATMTFATGVSNAAKITKVASTNTAGIAYASTTEPTGIITAAGTDTITVDLAVTTVSFQVTNNADQAGNYNVWEVSSSNTSRVATTVKNVALIGVDGKSTTFSITNSAPVAGDSYVVKVYGNGDVSTTAWATYTITYAKPVPKVTIVSPTVTGLKVLEGAKSSFKVRVRDIFNRPLASQAISVTVSGRNSISTTVTSDSDGYATYEYTDAGTTATATSDTVSFNSTNSSGTGTAATYTVTYIKTALGVASIAISNSQTTRTIDNVQADSADNLPAAGALTTLKATVRKADGTPVGSGVLVTFSGASASDLFYDDVNIDVTDANGEVEVQAYRNKVGTTTFTAKADGVTSSASTPTKWANTDATDARYITVTADPTTASPEGIIRITAKVTDRWGNPVNAVDVTISENGAGRLYTGQVANGDTNSSGERSWDLTSLKNESGSNSVTVTVTEAGTQVEDLAGKVSTSTVAGVTAGVKSATITVNFTAPTTPTVVVPPVAPTLTGSLNGRVLLFGACQADEGDLIVYVKSPGKTWQERAKTFECAAGEFDGSIRAPKSTKFYRVKQEGTGLWSSSVLIRR